MKKMKKIDEMWTGFERRRFSYTAYSPERRGGADRQTNKPERVINSINDTILRRHDSILVEAQRNGGTASEVLSKLQDLYSCPFSE
jgi:hypothetical protein